MRFWRAEVVLHKMVSENQFTNDYQVEHKENLILPKLQVPTVNTLNKVSPKPNNM